MPTMDRRSFLSGLGAVAGGLVVASAGAGADRVTGRGWSAAHATGSDALPIAPQALAENAEQGSMGWVLRGRQNPTNPGIEGYLDKVSVGSGDSLTLFVNTTASRFRVEIYRMGYYQGLGARLVHRSPELVGRQQPAPTFTPGTNLVECHWKPSRVFGIDKGYRSGNYLMKLVGSGGEERHVPFTVRDDSSRAAIVIQSSVTTWQAYNRWGGYSLYGGGPNGALADRARIVSFDRPYGPNLDASGSGDWLGNEFPFVYLAERLGLDVTYWTDVDLHVRPQLLGRHRCLVSLGHDEYWSMTMRLAASSALARGVNLAFLGANACYRQVRFEASALGPQRRQVCYKDAKADPIAAAHPALATAASWATGPVPWFESHLIGPMYQAFQPSGAAPAPLVVADASSWVFDGTGLRDGARLAGVVGSEFDAFAPAEGPANLDILAHSPITSVLGPGHADTTYYSVPGGGGVFASGTAQWVSLLWDGAAALDAALGFGVRPAKTHLTTMTRNVLGVFATGPASRTHASHPNWARWYRPGSGSGTGLDS